MEALRLIWDDAFLAQISSEPRSTVTFETKCSVTRFGTPANTAARSGEAL